MNSIVLTGTIIYDPEKKEYGQDNKVVVNLSIASGLKSINPKSGKKNTIFLGISAFGKLADYVMDECAKGDKVIISGELSFRLEQIEGKWKQTTAKITADTIEKVVDNESAPKPAPVEQTKKTMMEELPEMPPDIQNPFDDE